MHHPTRNLGHLVSDWVSAFVGSWYCLFLHAIWFYLWFYLRLDVNLLTLVVSLEAIFLCTILLMNANRQADKDRQAAEHDFQVNEQAKAEIDDLKQEVATLKEISTKLLDILSKEAPQ